VKMAPSSCFKGGQTTRACTFASRTCRGTPYTRYHDVYTGDAVIPHRTDPCHAGPFTAIPALLISVLTPLAITRVHTHHTTRYPAPRLHHGGQIRASNGKKKIRAASDARRTTESVRKPCRPPDRGWGQAFFLLFPAVGEPGSVPRKLDTPSDPSLHWCYLFLRMPI
jgi:hypothetical protein